MQDLLSEHPLRLLILLAEPESDSGLKKLHLLGRWSPWMEGLNIHPVFCCNASDSQKQVIQTYFPFPVEFESVSVEQLARALGRTVQKPVFGQPRCYIGAGLFLQDGSRLLHEARRINPSALQHLMESALKVQTAWLRARLREPIDTIFYH